MKIGLVMPIYGQWVHGDEVWAVCEKAKEIGVDSLYFVDHIIITPQQAIGQQGGYMDIWTAMSYVAAVTNVQGWAPTLGQCAAVVPYRPPIQQAKIAATVDSLSGGRLVIGAGTGYLESEFQALGLNILERSDMADEYIKAMIELWTHPVASFHGKYVNFDEMTISVRPVRQPHPPIVWIARGERSYRRIAQFCQGWGDSPSRGDSEALKGTEAGWSEVCRLWKEYGRTGEPYLALGPRPCHLTTARGRSGEAVVVDAAQGTQPSTTLFPVTHVADLVDQIRSFEAIGANEIAVRPASYRWGEFDSLPMLLNQMDLLAEHVLPKFRRG